MSERLRVASFVFASLAVTLPCGAWAQVPAGRLLAAQCAQCHGTDGNSITDIERLAGESASDLLGELLDMKHSGDTDDIMIRQAKGYTDEELRKIAAYFASLRPAGGGGDD